MASIIGLTAIGLYLVGRWQGAASVADAWAIQQAQDATSARVRDAYHDHLAQLTEAEQQHARNSQTWRYQVDSLRRLAVRVDTVVAVPDSAPVRLWRAVATAEHQGAQECALALTACQERAQTAEARAQALDSLLGNVLKVQSCRVLFLRCPSRTTTFLVGSGLGLVGGFWLGRH